MGIDRKWELVWEEVAVPEMEKAKIALRAALDELQLAGFDKKRRNARNAEIWKEYKTAINKTRKDYLAQKKAAKIMEAQ